LYVRLTELVHHISDVANELCNCSACWLSCGSIRCLLLLLLLLLLQLLLPLLIRTLDLLQQRRQLGSRSSTTITGLHRTPNLLVCQTAAPPRFHPTTA
jgi:hypothetical protein